MKKEYYLTNERRMEIIQDGFGWKEIDCFNKPVSLIFDNLRNGLHDVYLFNIGLMHSYLIEEWYPKIFEDEEMPQEDFENYFDKYFSDAYEIKKEKLYAYDEAQLKIQIKDCLDAGGIALVPCDIFDLYYYNNYHKEHMEHYFIIEGYDQERNILYIIDTLHVNFARNAEYEQFTITVAQLFKMYEQYFASFFPKQSEKSFWGFFAKNKDVDIFKKNKTEYKNLVSGILNGSVTVKYVEEVICKQIKKAVKENNTELIEKNIERVFKRGNYRKIYFSLLMNKVIDENKDKAIEKSIEEILQIWNQIKNLITYYYAAKKVDFSEIEKLIEKNKKNEKELWNKIYECL